MLDLLELDYEVKIYLRHPETWRGPLALFDVHPTGKAPILEVIFGDGRPPIKLAETGHIMQYLLRNYDPKYILTPLDPNEQLQVDYFLHFAEGSFQNLQISLLVNSVAKHVAPFGFQKMTKMITKFLNNGYYIHEWRLYMQYLDDLLKENGTGYFVGSKLTAADVILTYPIYENVFDNLDGAAEILHDKRDLKKLYPNLANWSKMIRRHPSYSRISQMMDEEVEDLILSKPQFTYLDK